jgi:hypothetical protein
MQKQLIEQGLPGSFCYRFLVSRGILLTGFLIAGAYIMSTLQSFNKI